MSCDGCRNGEPSILHRPSQFGSAITDTKTQGGLDVYRITAREDLASVTKLLKVEAPDVARKAKAGQFVVVRVNEHGERIPLTIAEYDRESGEVTIVFQEVGKTTKLLGTLGVGDELASFTGPLGRPTEIEDYGTVVCVGGGRASPLSIPLPRL